MAGEWGAQAPEGSTSYDECAPSSAVHVSTAELTSNWLAIAGEWGVQAPEGSTSYDECVPSSSAEHISTAELTSNRPAIAGEWGGAGSRWEHVI